MGKKRKNKTSSNNKGGKNTDTKNRQGTKKIDFISSQMLEVAESSNDIYETPKLSRMGYVVRVLIAMVIIACLACSVRSPDREVTNNEEGYEAYVSETGVPYFLDPDSYYHVRISEGIAENGHFGTQVDEDIKSEDIDGNEVVDTKAGSYKDWLREVPKGADTEYTPSIIYVAVALYRIADIFSTPSIEWIDFWLVCFFMIITVPITWLFTRKAYIAITKDRYGADVAGAAGALLVTCAPGFVTRTLAGNFETDMPQALFVMLLMLFMTEMMRSKTIIRSLLSALGFGITTLLYVKFWSNSALVLAGVAAIGGGIYVMSLLFAGGSQNSKEAEDTLNTKNSGRFRRWISNAPVKIYLVGAFLACIFIITPWGRPYLDTIISKIMAYMPDHYSQEVSAFNSVSELTKPDFAPPFFPYWFLGHVSSQSLTIVNGCGGILMIVSALACLVLLAYRAIRAKKTGKLNGDGSVYLFVLGAWFVICFFTCNLGNRMIQHFAFACAVLVAIFAGLLVGEMRKNWRTQTAKDAALTIILSVFIAVTMLFSVQGAVGTYRGMRGLITDSNAEAMNWTKNNAETEDAVVLSWWDLGYFYEYQSGHPVLWDGGGQDPIEMVIVSRLLITDDANLSRALMKMLCTTGTKAVSALTDKLGDNEGYDALWKLAVMDSNEAINALVSDYGFTEEQAERLESWLHPSDPREIYLVLTNRMTGQTGWFEYYGNWDFDGENIAPVNTSYAYLPDGSADYNSEDEEVQKFFDQRSKEIFLRAYFGRDGIETENGNMLDLKFEINDGYDSVQVWKVN